MKVILKVSAYIGDELARAGSEHELENGADLIKRGLATEAPEAEVEDVKVKADAPTNEEIVSGLELDDEDKAYLVENLGEFKLELKKDGLLNKKSLDKIDEILKEEE